MRGTINGAYLNRVVVNGRGGESLATADIAFTQVNATVLAAAAAEVGAELDRTMAAHAAVVDGLTLAGASLDSTQADQAIAVDGVVFVASMAEWANADQAVSVVFSPFLVRKTPAQRIDPHDATSSLVRHTGGTRLTLH